MSMNSTPIPMRGLRMRMTARASTFCPFRDNLMRIRARTGSGLLAHTKQPPNEMSEVTPSTRVPDSISINSTSAAKGNRMA